MKTLLTALFFIAAASSTLRAQTAQVIALTAQETAEAQSLHDQQKAIQAKLNALEHKIVLAHLVTTSNDWNCANADGTIKVGWNCGKFEYSQDFKYIVPSALPAPRATISTAVNTAH